MRKYLLRDAGAVIAMHYSLRNPWSQTPLTGIHNTARGAWGECGVGADKDAIAAEVALRGATGLRAGRVSVISEGS